MNVKLSKEGNFFRVKYEKSFLHLLIFTFTYLEEGREQQCV